MTVPSYRLHLKTLRWQRILKKYRTVMVFPNDLVWDTILTTCMTHATKAGRTLKVDMIMKWGFSRCDHQIFLPLPPFIYVNPKLRIVSPQVDGYFHCIALPETSSSPLNLGHPKRKGSYSNHPFSGVNSLLISGRVFQLFKNGFSHHRIHLLPLHARSRNPSLCQVEGDWKCGCGGGICDVSLFGVCTLSNLL